MCEILYLCKHRIVELVLAPYLQVTEYMHIRVLMISKPEIENWVFSESVQVQNLRFWLKCGFLTIAMLKLYRMKVTFIQPNVSMNSRSYISSVSS